MRTLRRWLQCRRTPHTKILLSWGLGVDSTAVLLRWCLDRRSRDFRLRDLIVIVANTGAEFTESHQTIEDVVFPILRRRRVRVVEIARGGPRTADGYVVLTDTRQPRRLHDRGPWTITDDYAASGSVVQTTGGRRCALRFKGEILDAWARDTFGDQEYRHAIGYSVGEENRSRRDKGCYGGGIGREPFFPLQDWDWNRATAESFLLRALGVPISKSFCRQCPFISQANEAGTALRLAAEPGPSGRIVVDELRALSLNPFAGVYGGRRLPGGGMKVRTFADMVTRRGLDGVRRAADEQLADLAWDLIRVRRLIQPAVKNPARSTAWRSVTVVATEPGRRQVLRYLHRIAARRAVAVDVDEHGIPRLWLRRPELGTLPEVTEFWTIAPHGVHSKEKKNFPQHWKAATAAARPGPDPKENP